MNLLHKKIKNKIEKEYLMTIIQDNLYNGKCKELSLLIYNYLSNQDIQYMKKTHPYYNIYIKFCYWYGYEDIIYIENNIKQYIKDNNLFKCNIDKYHNNTEKYIMGKLKEGGMKKKNKKKDNFIKNEYNNLLTKLKELIAFNKVKIKGCNKYPKLFESVLNFYNLKYKIINIHIDKMRLSNNITNKKYYKDTSYTEYILL